MHFIPATARNCCFISLAQLPVGKVMEFFNRLVIMESVTERQHLPVVVSDTPMLSPTSLWYAPVARNLRQVSSCRVGGKAQFLAVLCTIDGAIESKMYWMVAGRNLYLSKISSSEYSSSGFNLSRMTLLEILTSSNICRRRRRICRLWTAIFIAWVFTWDRYLAISNILSTYSKFLFEYVLKYLVAVIWGWE